MGQTEVDLDAKLDFGGFRKAGLSARASRMTQRLISTHKTNEMDAYGHLKRVPISIREVSGFTEDEVLEIHNCGMTTLRETVKWLEQFGLQLTGQFKATKEPTQMDRIESYLKTIVEFLAKGQPALDSAPDAG